LGIVYRALSRILDRHDAETRASRFDTREHIFNARTGIEGKGIAAATPFKEGHRSGV
jgi:hypothetical protein